MIYSSPVVSTIHEKSELTEFGFFLFISTKTVIAPCDGVVSGIEKDSVQLLSADSQGFVLTFLSNAPNGNDEIQYANYVGKVTAVGQNGWALLVNPQPVMVTDYTDLSGVSLEESTMTWGGTYAPKTNTQPQQPAPGEGTDPSAGEENQPVPGEGTDPSTGEENQPTPAEETPSLGSGEKPGMSQISTDPVYELVNGAWQQIAYNDISAGDILLFAVDQDGEFVWLVRVKKATTSTPGDTGDGFPSGGTGGGYPSGGMDGFNGTNGDFENFAADGETKTLDIGNAHISVEIDGGKASGDMDDIKAGAFVTITMNGKGEVTNVLVSSRSSFGGGRSPAN